MWGTNGNRKRDKDVDIGHEEALRYGTHVETDPEHEITLLERR